jgi:hypothetical protein
VLASYLIDYLNLPTDASSAYIDTCARPNGNTFVSKVSSVLPNFMTSHLDAFQISNLATDTQGYIARDDGQKEIVVALRGT